jgi:multidrug efflux system membrane fusion protein
MIKRFLPWIILIAFALGAWLILKNPPSVQRGAPSVDNSISVETQVLKPQSYQVMIDSYGKVSPRIESDLISQVSGTVTKVSPDFRAGGFFEKGDELLRLDDRDYQAELAAAQSELMAARQTLSEEQSRSDQAKADWKRLGNGNKVPELVARLPQLNAAKAAESAAKANVEQAKLNVERTRIRAPFAGRVLSKSVDIGQVVSSGNTMATVFAIDYLEVRLPIQSRDLPFIDLPEYYRHDENTLKDTPKVMFVSDLIGREEWQGELLQTAGAIDDESRQLYVLSKINDPYGDAAKGKAPLKIGQYVTAKIEGKTLENVIVIPNSVIYQSSYVYVLEDGALSRKEISIAWQNDDEAVISEGLAEGDELVTTVLGQVTSGTPAKRKGDEPAQQEATMKRGERPAQGAAQ